jgi:hypothetical protein
MGRRSPIECSGQRGRGQLAEVLRRINDLSTDHRENRLQVLNLLLRHRKEVRGENSKIGELTWSERSLYIFLV